jgi:hypothetical protein
MTGITKKAITFLLVSTMHTMTAADVVINEIYSDPPGTDPGYEWVELFNAGKSDIDVSGWLLDRALSSWSTRYTLPESTVIAAGTFLVIGDEFVESTGPLLISETPLGLGNAGSTGDAVRIVNGLGAAVDTVIYGYNNDDEFLDDTGIIATSLAPVADSGDSIGRVTDGIDSDDSGADFKAGQPTPGLSNFPSAEVFASGFEACLNQIQGYPDGDSDGYGDENADPSVFCEQLQEGYVENALDCDDANSNVWPGAVDWFTTPRNNGSYDYNCDDEETHRYNGITTGCSNSNAQCSVAQPGWEGIQPQCGQSGNYLNDCNEDWTATITACPACALSCIVVPSAACSDCITSQCPNGMVCELDYGAFTIQACH